jgi:hypothetical protein
MVVGHFTDNRKISILAIERLTQVAFFVVFIFEKSDMA